MGNGGQSFISSSTFLNSGGVRQNRVRSENSMILMTGASLLLMQDGEDIPGGFSGTSLQERIIKTDRIL